MRQSVYSDTFIPVPCDFVLAGFYCILGFCFFHVFFLSDLFLTQDLVFLSIMISNSSEKSIAHLQCNSDYISNDLITDIVCDLIDV